MDWKIGDVFVYKGHGIYTIELQVSKREVVIIGFDYPEYYKGKVGFKPAPKWMQRLIRGE